MRHIEVRLSTAGSIVQRVLPVQITATTTFAPLRRDSLERAGHRSSFPDRPRPQCRTGAAVDLGVSPLAHDGMAERTGPMHVNSPT